MTLSIKHKTISSLLVAIIFLGIILFINTVVAKAQTSEMEIYLNDEKLILENKPIIVNGYAMLPLRDAFKLFNCDNIAWDNTKKEVTAISGEVTFRSAVGEKTNELDQPPVINNGRVYVALRYISNSFDSNIVYENRKIYIKTPFVYKNGQWFTTGFSISNDTLGDRKVPELKTVTINNEEIQKVDNKIYCRILAFGSMFTQLYVLDASGKSKLLTLFDLGTINYKIAEETLYYLRTPPARDGWDLIFKASLSDEPMQFDRIGLDNFSYGAKIKLRYNSDAKIELVKEFKHWEIRPDGIYTVGYTIDAFDKWQTVGNMDLLKESYGYYLIDLATNTQTLVQKLDVEWWE